MYRWHCGRGGGIEEVEPDPSAQQPASIPIFLSYGLCTKTGDQPKKFELASQSVKMDDFTSIQPTDWLIKKRFTCKCNDKTYCLTLHKYTDGNYIWKVGVGDSEENLTEEPIETKPSKELQWPWDCKYWRCKRSATIMTAPAYWTHDRNTPLEKPFYPDFTDMHTIFIGDLEYSQKNDDNDVGQVWCWYNGDLFSQHEKSIKTTEYQPELKSVSEYNLYVGEHMANKVYRFITMMCDEGHAHWVVYKIDNKTFDTVPMFISEPVTHKHPPYTGTMTTARKYAKWDGKGAEPETFDIELFHGFCDETKGYSKDDVVNYKQALSVEIDTSKTTGANETDLQAIREYGITGTYACPYNATPGYNYAYRIWTSANGQFKIYCKDKNNSLEPTSWYFAKNDESDARFEAQCQRADGVRVFTFNVNKEVLETRTMDIPMLVKEATATTTQEMGYV